MPATYEPASDVEPLARTLIPEHHDHLASYRLRYVFRVADQPASRAGRASWGSARPLSGLARHLAGADAVVIVERSVWRRMDRARRLALLDHLLSHLVPSDDGLCAVGPDVSEFAAVLERHGAWHNDLERALSAYQERSLFDGRPADITADGERVALAHEEPVVVDTETGEVTPAAALRLVGRRAAGGGG
ncbi:MAG: hypothetical protein KGK07_14505 [Chloroflexota bacterium]|nr:hypothetical protein [Chloroflexota bacterium]